MRNYQKEYQNYQSSPMQKKKRASRNTARAKFIRTGMAKKGDGKDVIHRNGNPLDNTPRNLGLQKASKNRSFARTSTARKRNIYA
jgi:hypothetical protein